MKCLRIFFLLVLRFVFFFFFLHFNGFQAPSVLANATNRSRLAAYRRQRERDDSSPCDSLTFTRSQQDTHTQHTQHTHKALQALSLCVNSALSGGGGGRCGGV